MATHKKVFLFASWVILVATVILSSRGHRAHEIQSTPKYEITHGGAVLPEIKMPETAARTGARTSLAEQGSEVEACCASAVIDANGHVTKPSPIFRGKKHAATKRDQGSAPHSISGQPDRHDVPVPHPKPQKKKQKHSGGHSHAGASSGHSGGSPDNPTSHPFAPPFSAAFGAFA